MDYYSIPSRVQAAQWVKGNPGAQAEVLTLALSCGAGIEQAYDAYVEISHPDQADSIMMEDGHWLVCQGVTLTRMDDVEFRQTYATDPLSASTHTLAFDEPADTSGG